MGNTLVYRDTYEQALADLTAIAGTGATPAVPPQTSDTKTTQPTSQPAAPAQPPTAQSGAVLGEIRDHFRRYRDLSAQGKWAEAGRELEAVEQLVKR